MPDVQSLVAVYTTSWESPETNTRETGSTDAPIAQVLLSSLTKTMKMDVSGLRVLDYGAGRGAMSTALIDKGADVTAVEPFGCEFLTELGISAYRELEEVPKALRFDGIVCLEVIEHLSDPGQVLRSLYDRLLPGGWLFITTPNAAGLPARRAGETWREATKPGHIVFFTPTTLRESLRNGGFRRIRRPRWFIRYPHTSPLRTLAHFGLQKLAIDGGLRMIAYRP